MHHVAVCLEGGSKLLHVLSYILFFSLKMEVCQITDSRENVANAFLHTIQTEQKQSIKITIDCFHELIL